MPGQRIGTSPPWPMMAVDVAARSAISLGRQVLDLLVG
jgi:hypothetical protein